MHFYQHLKVLYLCGFHGDPTFLSYILPEMIVLNTCAKFEVKISVQNEWQHLTLMGMRTLVPMYIYITPGRRTEVAHARPPNGRRPER